MPRHNITLIPGDGIGPEVTTAAVDCIEATGVEVYWDIVEAGGEAISKKGLLPKSLLNSVRKTRIALKGPITTPIGSGFRSINVALRKEFDLFANVRPIKSWNGTRPLQKDVDIIIVRENTEDLYTGIEFQNGRKDTGELIDFVNRKRLAGIGPATSISLKVISARASRRIAKFAFRYALANRRKRLTVVHKANILKFSDGLFLKSAKSVAAFYKKIKFDDKIVDNMAMQLVMKPQEYDILLLPNLYGDIISDLCAGITGGLGLAPSGNFGERYAIFEPVHGSAPKYAGKDKVNPGATILSGAMMLRHIGETQAAEKIERAFARVLENGRHLTYDIARKKPVGTKRMTKEIIKYIVSDVVSS
jgi:isocitrate dehydrogenase (NAD+)